MSTTAHSQLKLAVLQEKVCMPVTTKKPSDLNKHQSWSGAQQHHTQEMDELNRGMLRLHGSRLSYQAHMGTFAGTKFPSVQMLLCHIRPLHRALPTCFKCVHTLVLSFRSVCINRGLNLCCSVFSLM